MRDHESYLVDRHRFDLNPLMGENALPAFKNPYSYNTYDNIV